MNYKSSIFILCILALAVSAYGQAEFFEKGKSGYGVSGQVLSQEGAGGIGLTVSAINKGNFQVDGSFYKIENHSEVGMHLAVNMSRLGDNDSVVGLILFGGISGTRGDEGTLAQIGAGLDLLLEANSRLKFIPYIGGARITPLGSLDDDNKAI